MVSVHNLTKRYGAKVAVDDLSFEVATGCVTGFLGPNGAGKSTTMRLMLGLDKGGGETLFGGKRLDEYAQKSKVVGFLLEARAFHPTRTARSHLRVLAAADGVRDVRVEEVLEMVGLTEVAGKAPGTFSLGMSQRLGIAAAVLAEPRLLMLDEPANGLDPEGIAWLRGFLRSYAKGGNAVFVSSHLLGEMEHMADHVVVIGRGKLIDSTSMHDFVSRHGKAAVFVRTKNIADFKQALQRQKIAFTKEGEGLVIAEMTTDQVAAIATAAGTPVLELTSRAASLEEAFLELTAGAEEYRAGGGQRGAS